MGVSLFRSGGKKLPDQNGQPHFRSIILIDAYHLQIIISGKTPAIH